MQDSAAFQTPVRGSTLAMLDRLCTTTAEICGCEVVVLAYNRNKRTRILASHGAGKRFGIHEFDMETAPFGPQAEIINIKAGKDPKFIRLGAPLGVKSCEFFARLPVSITDRHAVSLLAVSGSVQKPLSKARLAAMRESAQLAHDELAAVLPVLDDDDLHVTALTDLASLGRDVTASERAVALLDHRLTILAVSDGLANILGKPAKSLCGASLASIGLQSGEAIRFMFRKALDEGLSPPEFEVIRAVSGARDEVFAVTVSPMSPTDTKDDFLFVSVRDVTAFYDREEALERRVKPRRQLGQLAEEPSLQFLLDTLVNRRSLRERNGVGYLTLDGWRQPIRTYQIAALKALKARVPVELGRAAAVRISDEVSSFIGLSAFRFVVPVPCSNSSSDSCLSLEIARALGAQSGLPVIQCLYLPGGGGPSHPKKNARRPRMELLKKIEGPVLLVDDVATSGAHIEEAVKLLKPVCGAVMAVAWIGGNVAKS